MKHLISEKGIAVLSAIDVGLCPKTEEGYETDIFEKFWEKFMDGLVEQRTNGRKDFGNLGDKITGKSTNNRDKNLKIPVTSFVFALIGFLIGFFF